MHRCSDRCLAARDLDPTYSLQSTVCAAGPAFSPTDVPITTRDGRHDFGCGHRPCCAPSKPCGSGSSGSDPGPAPVCEHRGLSLAARPSRCPDRRPACAGCVARWSALDARDRGPDCRPACTGGVARYLRIYVAFAHTSRGLPHRCDHTPDREMREALSRTLLVEEESFFVCAQISTTGSGDCNPEAELESRLLEHALDLWYHN